MPKSSLQLCSARCCRCQAAADSNIKKQRWWISTEIRTRVEPFSHSTEIRLACPWDMLHSHSNEWSIPDPAAAWDHELAVDSSAKTVWLSEP
mmetsp:Transcript_49568/g.118045  ORF Transcript_49568/g.118045 Transcript_49568/m.118045 type:complete len:92 (-) Transcript_49568:145-420(-)